MKPNAVRIWVIGILLLVVSTRSHAEGQIEICIVPHDTQEVKGGKVMRKIYTDRVFYVVVSNRAGKRLRLWNTSNSWGYYNLFFSYETESGKRGTIRLAQRYFSRNVPDYRIIDDRECCLFPIDMSAKWKEIGQLRGSVSLKCNYVIPQTKEAKELDVLVGEFSSKESRITFVGPTRE